MKRFVEGVGRDQGGLFPSHLEDFVAEDNPVRAVDAFVEVLDLRALGFAEVEPSATGRPGYHPAVLLKLYIYGYLNAIASSRRLERESGRNVELMWPDTSGGALRGRFTIQDFIYDPGRDRYTCPAGQLLSQAKKRSTRGPDPDFVRYRNLDACGACTLKPRCKSERFQQIRRWKHDDVLDAMQRRLERMPKAMTIRRRTVEHPFGTIKAWMGATHFLTRTLPKVKTEMSLNVLAYNLKRMIALYGVEPLIRAMAA
jgi:hypothetical protein